MDEAFLLRVFASTRAAEFAPLGWPAVQQQVFLQSQYAAQRQSFRAQFPGAEHSVILCDGAPVGRLIVDRGADAMRLVDIALLPTHCGRGLGTRLLQDLCGEADAQRKPLRLHVFAGNRAARLYARFGFVPLRAHGLHMEMERRPPAA